MSEWWLEPASGASAIRSSRTPRESRQCTWRSIEALFSERAGEQGLRGFLQIGTSSGAPNRVSDYVGAGIICIGPLPGRDEDSLGLVVALAPVPLWPGAASAETDVELLYRSSPWARLTVQPTLHCVIRPGGSLKNALVVGLRLETRF